MRTRYAPAIAVVGALVGLAASVGAWPEAVPTLFGIAAPIAGISVLILLASIGRFLGESVTRALIPFITIGGLALALLGGYGYVGYLLEETTSVLGPGLAIFGGITVGIGAFADWRDIPPESATNKVRAGVFGGLLGIAGLVSMVAWQVVMLVFGMVILGRDLVDTELIIISGLSLGAGMGTVAVIYILYTDRGWGFIDLSMPSLYDIGWTFAGTIGLFAALIVIVQVIEFTGAPMAEHEIVELATEGDPDILLWLIPASLLLIGPGEELLFRNIIQKSLYDNFTAVGAIVVASIIFAIAHFPAYGAGPESVGPMLVIFTLSLILGGIYVKTKNILVPALIHGIYNAIQFGGLYVQLTAEENAAWLAYLIVF